jgi:hypothetical protein
MRVITLVDTPSRYASGCDRIASRFVDQAATRSLEVPILTP